MLSRTIAKFLAFVILIAAAVGSLSCGDARSNERNDTTFDAHASPYTPPKVVGRISSNDIQESSGLAASKCQPNIFWTHNDSGDGPYIFAIDQAGENLGTWKVEGARNEDWEDIDEYKDAAGNCYIYIGEIGNNEGKREHTLVYRIREPTVGRDTAGTTRKEPLATEPAESVIVNYPSTRPNAETLMVHPISGDIYIVTKRTDGPASVYRIAPAFGSEQTAVKLAEIKVPSVPNGQFTGGDISPDGGRLVLCDYIAGYELTLPAGDGNFDDIWSQPPVKFNVGDRKGGEAIAYGPDGSKIFTTSEGKNPPIFEMDRK